MHADAVKRAGRCKAGDFGAEIRVRQGGRGGKMKNRKLLLCEKCNKHDASQPHNAYLTVYLALCLMVILSLFLTLIDGTRRNGARLEAEIVTDIGLQSIMAEYHRELMKQYNLFAIDASYGTALCTKANTEAHLMKYLKKNLNYEDVFLSNMLYRDFLGLRPEHAELKRISLLTDGGGEVFRRCAVEAIKSDVGLDLLKEVQGWMETIEVNGLEEGKEEKQKQEYDAQIEEIEDVEIDNPTDKLEQKKKRGILKLVTENDADLSQNVIYTDNLIMGRMQQGQVNRGNMAYDAQSDMERITEKFIFQEYLLQYMGRYGGEQEEDALHYQIEYLIAGKNSDMENLQSVANRLCALREAANAMYLLSDKTKRAEIKAAAELACLLALSPQLIPVVEGVILLAWAYAESIYDVKSLLAGGKVPLIKDENSWHYGLSAALEGDLQDETKDGGGLAYKDYLRIFMMLADTDTITARAMNMVEADIRKTPGNAAFRLDGCYDAVEAYIRIGSSYGFQYEITRQKSYH